MTSVLIIDDETDVRESIAKVLSRAGYDVQVAENADVGIGLLKNANIDVLITDIIMPGMDGVQAIRNVRDIQPNLKIVAISGGGNFGPRSYQPEAITTTAYLQAAMEAGADTILTKPFQRADLVNAIAGVLSQD